MNSLQLYSTAAVSISLLSTTLCTFQFARPVTINIVQQSYTLWDYSWCSIWATNMIPQGEELSIIVVQVVVSMVSWSINKRFEKRRYTIICIMDRHHPEIHKNQKYQIEHFVQGNRKGYTWYGILCRKPSNGWKAWLAKGVGTFHLWWSLWKYLYSRLWYNPRWIQ